MKTRIAYLPVLAAALILVTGCGSLRRVGKDAAVVLTSEEKLKELADRLPLIPPRPTGDAARQASSFDLESWLDQNRLHGKKHPYLRKAHSTNACTTSCIH